MINEENYKRIMNDLSKKDTQLIAVSKRKPVEDIMGLYELGHRDFGENRVQELTQKAPLLPDDIRWHFIGHLQSNKVKYIVPFVYMIHSVDKPKLLKEINKQSIKVNRKIKCLIQYHIAEEENKFGFTHDEVLSLIRSEDFPKNTNVEINGLMAMATNTLDKDKVRSEFKNLHSYFIDIKDNYIKSEHFNVVSMGMSGDYELAIEEGSNMVRLGSVIFGKRD